QAGGRKFQTAHHRALKGRGELRDEPPPAVSKTTTHPAKRQAGGRKFQTAHHRALKGRGELRDEPPPAVSKTT
ncbi:hypothetical protein ADL01_28440, partial [Streptomyces sp. NRRL WC-3618]